MDRQRARSICSASAGCARLRWEPRPIAAIVFARDAAWLIGQYRKRRQWCPTCCRRDGFKRKARAIPDRAKRSRPTKRLIYQHPLSASPLNDANLMAGLHASDRVDTKPTEQGGGVESL